MNSLKKNARIAGLLYLLVVLTGPFVLLYVPGKLFVAGDATATVQNIVNHEFLFRTYIVVGLLSELLFISVVFALYRLLKEVHRPLAMLMVILVLIDAPLAFLSISNDVATLSFARGAEFLSAFASPQRNAIAALLIYVDRQAVLIREVFWGLWLIPLASLVYRSGFFPRLIGIWLLVNGLAYVAISLTGLLAPEHLALAKDVAMPALLGEVALMLWLLIVGVRTPPSRVTNSPNQ